MSLLTIAEVLAGETLVSPGGPVDRLTAAADEVDLWQMAGDGSDAAEHVVQEEFALV
jgi:hypothetical protein